MVMRRVLISRVSRAVAALALRSSALRCFVQSLETDLVRLRIASAGEVNLAISVHRDHERGLAAIGKSEGREVIGKDEDVGSPAAAPNFVNLSSHPLTAIPAEGSKRVADGDAEIDAGDDPPLCHLIRA